MPILRLAVSVVSLFAVVMLAFAPPVFGQQSVAATHAVDLNGLLVEIERTAKTVGGTVGVGVRHIETGREVYLNRTVKFPMGSVFKLPLAVQVLTLVDRGSMDLSRIVVMQPGDLRPGSGKLVRYYRGPQPISLRELLDRMMIDSDNTATDILWKEAGGAAAIMARLGALGITGISVDRATGPLLAAAGGFGELAPDADMTPAGFDELGRKFPRGKRKPGFLKDERDTTTPEGVVTLLQKLWRQETMSAQHTALLIDIMYRCETGKGRLKSGLPARARLAHKTGTLRPHVVNDVGIVALPGNGGHLIIAVLIKESRQELAVQERAIAGIARAVFEHFDAIAGAF